MSTMDLKGIAWVGNIYQKFEAMCLEVEETMYQDTAKYVENQVQTVGASVKRFYSDVMLDLLPPSCMDPEKVVDTDLSLNAYADVEIHKKSKSLSKKDTLAVDNLFTEDCKKNSSVGSDRKSSFKGLDNLSNVQPKFYGGYSEKNKARETYRRSNVGIKRISKRDNYSLSDKSSSKNPKSDNFQVACDEISVLSSQASVENIVCGSSEKGKKSDYITDANASVDDDKIESPVSDVNLLEDSSGMKETRLRDINSNGGLPGESIETCTNSVLVSHRVLDTGGDDTHNDHSADEEVFISHADVIEDNDATEPTVEDIKQEDKSKLEETCVLVDGDKLGFLSPTEGKNRSYKKKFRKAFSLKMRSGRKQEYEQLAAQYGDAETPLNLRSGDSVGMPTLTTDLHTGNSNSCESEWELL